MTRTRVGQPELPLATFQNQEGACCRERDDGDKCDFVKPHLDLNKCRIYFLVFKKCQVLQICYSRYMLRVTQN